MGGRRQRDNFENRKRTVVFIELAELIDIKCKFSESFIIRDSSCTYLCPCIAALSNGIYIKATFVLYLIYRFTASIIKGILKP